MKKARRIVLLLIMMLLIPFSVNAKNNDKVKVYIFEAGGCPYCEAQIEYLKGLDSYNKKFEIVEKEAYKDHIAWEQGKDYDLAVEVGDAFEAAGYGRYKTDGYHLYQSTPFVVIGNVYAEAAYNTALEEVINQVYEDGDKDIVGCFEKGKKDCADEIEVKEGSEAAEEQTKTKTNKTSSDEELTLSDKVVITSVLIGTVAIVVAYLIKSTMDTNKIVRAIALTNTNTVKETTSKTKKK